MWGGAGKQFRGNRALCCLFCFGGARQPLTILDANRFVHFELS
jgi:hypothetical protein